MIRVALLAHLSEVSGAGVALLETARGLDQTRFVPILILPGAGPLGERARAAGVTVEIVENPQVSLQTATGAAKARLTAQRAAYVARLTAFLRRQKFDVAYVNSTASIFAGMAAAAARIPIVWHVHETIDRPTAPSRLKLRTIESLSSAILYASHSAQAMFPAQRVSLRLVARNFVDVEAIAAALPTAELDESLGLRPAEMLVTMNGIFPRKGTDIFLRAASRMAIETQPRPIKFLVVGATTEEHGAFRAELDKYVADRRLENMVAMPGARDDMPQILKRSTIFVSPSRNEALPISMVEALAAGVPVIATDVGDCRLLLKGGEYGALVPPENPDALAAEIQRVLNHPEEAARKARAGQEQILRDYAAEGFFEPVENLLARVVRR
ncbi:MAG: glycosyltransferase [Candidatus Sumerlaeaceae bacterium]|nr:glycosyltransferase [Candidatus Sumerlaeaceae bacterium]